MMGILAYEWSDLLCNLVRLRSLINVWRGKNSHLFEEVYKTSVVYLIFSLMLTNEDKFVISFGLWLNYILL